jgi:hypothetical protein
MAWLHNGMTIENQRDWAIYVYYSMYESQSNCDE